MLGAVAENILAALALAGGQKVLGLVRGQPWEAQVKAACHAAMARAIRHATETLDDAAINEAVGVFTRMLGPDGPSQWLINGLAKGFRGADLAAVLSASFRERFGQDVYFLSEQGIDLDELVRAFPEALIDELLGSGRPDQPLYQVAQSVLVVMRLGALEKAVWGPHQQIERLQVVSETSIIRELPTPGTHADQATRNHARDDRIFDTFTAVTQTADPEALSVAARSVEGLLVDLSEEIRQDWAAVTARIAVVDELVDKLIEKHPQAGVLLPKRAGLRGRQGQWDRALADLQRFIDIGGPPTGPILLESGALLMNLGSYAQARHTLQRAKAAGLTPTDELKATHLQLWIDDYQGRHLHVVRQSHKLWRTAKELGAPKSQLSGIQHRMGRAMFAAALANGHDRALMKRSLQRLEHACDLNQRQHPFDAFWVYRISAALETRDRERLWQEAREQMAVLGQPAAGHLYLIGGARARQRELWIEARAQLQDALDLWKIHPYPKGLFDVARQLADTYRELPSNRNNRRTAILFYRLADRLGTRLGLADLPSVRQRLSTELTRSAASPAYLLKEADDQLAQLSFSSALTGYSLTLR
jgi:tetratricopeptide (TPR) repeat protein